MLTKSPFHSRLRQILSVMSVECHQDTLSHDGHVFPVGEENFPCVGTTWVYAMFPFCISEELP